MARGFIQKEGVDYNDIFSHVVKHECIKMLLAMVVEFNLELKHTDVKNVCLYGDLEGIIYMEQHKRFKVGDKKCYVCKLNKSLYSLKQSQRQWDRRFDKFIVSIGFECSKYDTCVYFKFLEDSLLIV